MTLSSRTARLLSTGGLAAAGTAGLALVTGSLIFGAAASARPPAAQAYCTAYPDAHVCGEPAKTAPCATCHTVAPAMNLFGAQLQAELRRGRDGPLDNATFLAALPGALRAVEGLDADGDGVTNLAEFVGGSRADDPDSRPVTAGCSPAERSAAAGARWNACGYDPAYAYRKVHLDFCGRSPTRAETAAFNALLPNQTAWREAMGKALDQCLKTPYWAGVDGVLWNIANPKIGPVEAIKAGPRAGPIPLADYEWDYNLYTWANTGDRDVRDLLTAQYFVRRTSDAPPTFEVADEALLRRQFQAGQTVPANRRAGMLTTRWFAQVNTMFTAVPRTTAAQAYRSYLGLDIAKMEGLHPVLQEPADYDAKGVEAPECAVCHSTLDPLSYPFTRYNGIIAGNYDPNRLRTFVRTDGPDIVRAPEAGVLFGQPVKDLLEWAQVAANSEAFAQKVVFDYWKELIGREPTAGDQREYFRLWRGLMSPTQYNYRVERMLHALILTDAYGTP